MNTTEQEQKHNSQDLKEERDQCVIDLVNGKSVDLLSESCKELLGAVSKTGLIIRREAAVAKVWNLQDGHGSRQTEAEETLGLTIDNPEDNKTVGEIFAESKTSAGREQMKRSIAKTISQGVKSRGEELVSDKDIKRAKKNELIRRASQRANH